MDRLETCGSLMYAGQEYEYHISQNTGLMDLAENPDALIKSVQSHARFLQAGCYT